MPVSFLAIDNHGYVFPFCTSIPICFVVATHSLHTSLNVLNSYLSLSITHSLTPSLLLLSIRIETPLKAKMLDMKLQVFFVSIAWAVGATYHEGWLTTECTTTTPVSQWSTCTPTEITLVETQTILQTAPPISALTTSVIKFGTVLNTTQTATASALKRRDYKGWVSKWDTKPADSWTAWELCSPSTLTKTLTEYITSIIAPSTTTKTLIETQPGMLSAFFPRPCQHRMLTVLL